ncbi:MAG: hypothetical protein R6W76_14505 [Caldilinea sp.]
MPLSVRVMWLPKAGNRDDEYEDACWPERSLTTAQSIVRCAVADGATESAFAGLWARQLVYAYGAGGLDAGNWPHALALEQVRWQTQVAAKALPWYAEEKARSGAFAALLGVTIGRSIDGAAHTWQAMAVGDCAFFQVRDNALQHCFPAEDATFFTNRPLLISSIPAQNEELAEHVHHASGELQSGDLLYLTSDALGQWFLNTFERGGTPWVDMETMITRIKRRKRSFNSWVHELRRSGQMRNDDVTILRIAWSEQ